jgi:hypothetical protein
VSATTDRVRRWLPWAVSLGVSGGLLTYLFASVDRGMLVAAARGIAVSPFLAFIGLFLVGVLARACRFWLLTGRTVPFPLMAGITIVRNLFVDLLPARLGELSYVYLLTTRAKRSPEEGVATLGVAMLLDLVALAPLLFLALLVVGRGGTSSSAVLIALSVALALGGYGAVRWAGPVSRAVADRLALGGFRIATAVVPRLRLIADSLDRSVHVLPAALALSFVVRICKYGSFYYLFLSILLPLGYTADALGVPRVFLAQVSAELAAALPVHGIAGFGTYEAAWSFTLERFGFPREHAVITGFLSHVISQILEYVLGSLALIWLLRPKAA